jgi:hypothetical protein
LPSLRGGEADEAIQPDMMQGWIASLTLAMTTSRPHTDASTDNIRMD